MPAVVGLDEKPALSEDCLDAAQLGQSMSDQVREEAKGLVSDQPGRPDAHLVTPALTNLTDDQRRIMTLCEVPRTQAELMREIGLSHRTFFRRKRLDPLLRAGLIRRAPCCSWSTSDA